MAFESAALCESMADDVVAFAECGGEVLARLTPAAHFSLDFAEFRLEPIEVGERCLRLLSNRVTCIRVDFLTKKPDPRVPGAMDLATIMGGLTLDHVEQCRLARAVGTDDADAISCANDDRSASKEHSVTDSFFELRESQ